MPPIQHFKTVFWSQKQPELTLPDFQTGYSVLHQKLAQSKVENEEMIYFFKERIAIEEGYASKLSDQGKYPLKSTGFARDEGAGLVKCFGQLKETSRRMGEQHKITANAVQTHVLSPLQEFHEDYKRNVSHSKQAVDSMLKQFDGLIKEAERSRHTYHRKCKEADKAEEQALKQASSIHHLDEKSTTHTPSPPPPSSSSSTSPPSPPPAPPSVNSQPEDPNSITKIQLGNQIMPQAELDGLVRRMRQEIAMGDHRVPILGTYKNTSTGEDIAIWLQHNLPQCKDSPAMADVVGQQLIQPYNILRLIGQRGNKFTASSNTYYQWRVVGDDDTSSIASSSTTEATYAALGGLMEKITTAPPLINPSTTTEEPHKKSRREAEKADQAYRSAVLKLDQMRMAIEEAMFAHLTEMEQVELKRIQQLKEFISSFIASMSVLIPQDKLVIEEMMVFQESLKPDQDIQFIVQQYAVASFSPKAILYDNYYHGISHDQVFGVPLEELGKQTQDNVPRFISILLEVIEKGIDKTKDEEQKKKIWSTPCALDRVHATCMELNIGSDLLSLEILEKYDPELLVAVLRYFLLELPECLMTYEFYDPVDALLGGGNDNQEESLRLASFSNLISTLPGSHFETLKAIFENITSFVNKVDVSEEIIHSICQSLGPVILRSRVESFTVLNSKVPVKFVHELIKHTKDIFSESTIKLHAESEKRRHARPIIAPQPNHDEAKSNNNKRGTNLMSFMRPAINTDELNKWTMNSVMGVFQRNNNNASPTQDQQQQQQQQQQQATTSQSSRSVPLAFGSIITRHESPPSSPRISPAITEEVVEENKVMFNSDHIFDDEVSQEKPDDILKDFDEKPKVAAQPDSAAATAATATTATTADTADTAATTTTTTTTNNNTTVPKEDQKNEDEKKDTPEQRPHHAGHIDSSFFDDDDDEDED